MSSSAIAITVGGMVSLSAFAVPRLMANSNFVGRITGISAMFAPLRINLDAHLVVGVHQIGPVTHQTSSQRKFANVINRRKCTLRRQLNETLAPRVEKRIVFTTSPATRF